jgi:coenzyme F420-reducing hydrogenase beta subunit
VYKCPSEALEMDWNEHGFLVPIQTISCDSCNECLSVCPFNPDPEQGVETENELADRFLDKKNSSHHKIGKYTGIYAGYANDFRLQSSSGGIATFVFMELFDRGIVDHIFSVKESANLGTHYEYAISSSKKELLTASKTRYYPVTLSNVFEEIDKLKGKVAISGVACFIKAIRLAQYHDPALKKKIPFLVGIICGGIKSSYYTDYLANKMGISAKDYEKPEYRIKNLNSSAGDYSFGCTDSKSKHTKTIRMKTVGDMWGTGLFKANACDFCDDVTTELADISLGDAWIKPYHLDGRGTNLFVTRSNLADNIINEGNKTGKVYIEKLDLNRFLASQQGSFNHRHIGLSVRVNKAKKQNIPIPPKRFDKEKVSFDFKLVQLLRMKIRKKSLQEWKQIPQAVHFDKRMRNDLSLLKLATTFYHHKKTLFKKIEFK